MAALAAVATAGALAWTIAAVDFGGAGSPRKAAVERLLAAARGGDEAAMARLLTPGAQLVVSSSFDTQIVPAAYVADNVRNCPTVAMSEALGVVAVELGCANDRRGEFILDFAFCGERIAEISADEDGRWLLSPLGRVLGRRLFGESPNCG